jgi:hypothetical protein
MKKIVLALIMVFAVTNVSFAEQWVTVPQVVQPSPQIVVIEPAPVIIPAPRPLVKTIEWILTPQVNNVVVPEIHRGLFGRQYIVNRNELVTTWVYTPVEVWK